MKLKLHRAKIDPSPHHPVCLITGDGRTLLDDLETVRGWNLPADVMAIGRSIKTHMTCMHWANVDGLESKWWAEHLPTNYDGKMPIRHSLGDFEWYDVDWDDGQDMKAVWHGSSGLFAVMVALALGYKKVVLAGVPMDKQGHWYFPDDKGPDWNDEDYQAWRDFARTPEARKVESLSGFTREVLNAGC